MTRWQAGSFRGRLLVACERALLVLGSVTAGVYGVSVAHSSLYQAEAGHTFDRWIREKGTAADSTGVPFSRRDLDSLRPWHGGLLTSIVKTDEWATAKVRAFEERLALTSPPPLARLQIPSLELSAMVIEGTDEVSLIRGVGHIEGTSLPGEYGNVGLAGHRDSFFRGLSRIATNAEIVLTTLEGRDLRYTVNSIDIVEPDRVDVLSPTERPSLTLVTCYPFYFIGSAPLRYVVRASLEESRPMGVVAPWRPARPSTSVIP